MKSNYLVWVIVAGLIIAGAYYWMKPGNMTTTEPSPTATTQTKAPVVVALATQNNLGQSGTATLTENAEGNLVVTLAMTGGSFSSPQPAHIHVGSCPNPGAVKYPLANVVNGQSETVLDVSWSDLENGGEKLAINVHKSAAESKVYTACGDLPVKETMAAPTTTPAPAITY